jgi:hypothetical protein
MLYLSHGSFPSPPSNITRHGTFKFIYLQCSLRIDLMLIFWSAVYTSQVTSYLRSWGILLQAEVITTITFEGLQEHDYYR